MDESKSIQELEDAIPPVEFSKVGGALHRLAIDKLVSAREAVDHPQHYRQGKIECIDAIESSLEGETSPRAAGLKWQVMKYLWRFRYKGTPIKDLRKARWYLERLIREVEKETPDHITGTQEISVEQDE